MKGIGITAHPNCESVSFYFDSQGNLRDPLAMIMILEGNLKPEDTYVSVKTQFSNPDVHITIIKLLKYLQKRYIPDLQDIDEGDYWESGDEERLKEKMAFLDEKIDMVADALSSVDFVDFSEYTESEMVSLIEEILRKKLRSD